MSYEDTIFALATAPGKAGVAILRVSGPGAKAGCARLCGHLPKAGEARLRRIVGESGDVLDTALVLVFEKDASFTGEETVELHVHGSTAIVSAVLNSLARQPGFRIAEPGEFTRRALENGRMDLAQVEGLADLIESETELQRMQAARVFTGAVGDMVEGWRRKLIRAASLIEVTIDFVDEEVPTDVWPEVTDLVAAVKADIAKEIAGSRVSERIREGFEVAIVGPPNAGKSTLLNALAGREAAITSEHAGTTRDIIEVRMDLKGIPAVFLDTAGLRSAQDPVEQIGISRAKERAERADICVFLKWKDLPLDLTPRHEDIVLTAKADLVGLPEDGVSGETGFGVDSLLDTLAQVLGERAAQSSVVMRSRQRVALERADSLLGQFLRELETNACESDLMAEELRSAIRALDSLIGRVDVEHLLDEIFASFCLGK